MLAKRKTKNPRICDFPLSHGEKGMNDSKVVEDYFKTWKRAKYFFRRIAKKTVKLNPDAVDIADIGTGPGFLAIELSKLTGKRVLAVDISPNMLKKAQSYANAANAKIEIIEASCEKLPFEDNSLDLLSSSSFIHCLQDIQPLFSEINRVLRKDGAALITGFRRDTWRIFERLRDLHKKYFLKNKPMERFFALHLQKMSFWRYCKNYRLGTIN